MIEFKNVSLKFGDKKIFENISFKIEKGEKILLNAPSGRGKSSLLKVLMGFIEKDSGSIIFNGKKIDSNNISDVRESILWINQDVNLRKVIVKDLLEEIFSYENNKKIIYKKKLNALLNEFHLDIEILNKNTEKLSGGERQRLGLIIGILLDRDVMCLDEVTSSLDIEMKRKVEEYIIKSKKTILLISHDTHWDLKGFREVKW